MKVSKILGFEVAQAAKALKTSLESVDGVMEITLSSLDNILKTGSGNDDNLNDDVHSEILGIMNETTLDVHVTAQPMINVS